MEANTEEYSTGLLQAESVVQDYTAEHCDNNIDKTEIKLEQAETAFRETAGRMLAEDDENALADIDCKHSRLTMKNPE